MKKRYVVLISLVILFGAFASYGYYIVVFHVLPYSPIRPHRVTLAEVQRDFPRAVDPSYLGLKYRTLDVVVQDTIELKGWFVDASTDTALGTMVLLHGIGSCKEALLPFADTLARHGYNSILYDSRAQGESGGTNCTFGYYEKYDVLAYIHAAQNRFGHIGPIGIFGSSMGAAVAIQAMALDHGIRCGIVESPFATLRQVIYQYWKRMFLLPLRFIPNEALDVSEKIAHFSADSVRPEESAKLITQPVMVVHGDDDKRIPAEDSRRVFDNLKSRDKMWYPIAGAGHNDIQAVGGQRYLKAQLAFLRAHLFK